VPLNTLILTIKEELLADKPNIKYLLQLFANEYGLDAPSSSRLLTHIVRELNAQLFPAIQKLELMLTYNCNLRCAYCFEKRIRKKGKMAPATAYKAIDLLFDYSGDNKDLYITHFGGEPSLNFSVLSKATKYAEQQSEIRSKKIHFNITTNGVALSDQMLDFFKQHEIKVLFSVDGLKPSHDRYRIDSQGKGTFDRVIDALSRYKSRASWIGVKMTVVRENIPRLVEDVTGLYEMGVNQFLLGPATNNSWREEDIKNYFNQLESLHQWYQREHPENLRISEFEGKQSNKSYFGCQACRDTLSVDVDGKITGCSKIRSLEHNTVVGKLGDIRHGLTNIQQRHNFVDCAPLKENCFRIGIHDYYGGCFASNYEQNKDFFIPNLFDHTVSICVRQMLEKINEYSVEKLTA